MAWVIVEDRPGEFTIRVAGHDVGTMSMLPRHPVTGRDLMPTFRAKQFAAQMNGLDQDGISARERQFRAAGWISEAAFAEEREVCRLFEADLPDDVVDPARAEFMAGWEFPARPEQMAAWEAELNRLTATQAKRVAA